MTHIRQSKGNLREIDRTLLTKFLERTDARKHTQLEYLQMLYDYLLMVFKPQWLEAEAEVDRMSELVVKKNIEIDRLQGQVVELTSKLKENDIEIPTHFKTLREHLQEQQTKESTRK